MKTRSIVFPASVIVLAMALAQEPAGKSWKKRVMTRDFLTEGLSAGDLDGDGMNDLVAGAFWFKGPDFKEPIPFRPGKAVPTTAYQEDSFLSWVDDLNGDGKNDILMASHPGKNLTLYLNPGKTGDWPAHVVMTEAATESPLWTDVDGDGKKECICMQGGKFGYAVPDWKDVTKPWVFIAISEKRTETPYIHGLGAGDLNGDGRMDILEKEGWFEQTAAKDASWAWHKETFGQGGAQMLVFDADGDGDNDIITSLNAHGYGLAWYENRKTDGNVTFARREILPEDPAKTGADGLQFSQLHSLAMGDFDKDGRMDFVTGKRYYAHNGHDPGANDPALVVIFYNRKEGDDGVRWQPELIDADSGVGCQVLAIDLDQDGNLEVAVGNKKGVQVIGR